MFVMNFVFIGGMFHGESLVVADCFGTSTFDLNSGHEISFRWPMPAWVSFLDVSLVAAPLKNYKGADSQNVFDAYIAAALWVVARVAMGLESNLLSLENDFSWKWIAETVHGLAGLSLKMRESRKKLLRRWARSRAGLFACPEFGLSANNAMGWLDALETAFGAEWSQVREELIAEREYRMNLAIAATGGLKTTADAVFAELSRAYPGHPGNDLIRKQNAQKPSGLRL